jgi:aspartyl-tRNA(Asn)/glutamyl-tRNA(Gln) amidotransferase subunit C
MNVRDVARLARLALSDEEATQFQAQLGHVLEYVAQLEALDLSGVEPTAAIHDQTVTRPDVARPFFSPEEALANAPAQSQGQFQVIRVVG